MNPVKPAILFLCVANSARSQMAESIARAVLPKDIEVYSAGSSPTRINPYAVRVMQEIGFDISKQVSKAIDAIPMEQIATVVTLCAEEICPIVPGNVTRLHWPIRDPATVTGTEDVILDAFRKARDEIEKRIKSADFTARFNPAR